MSVVVVDLVAGEEEQVRVQALHVGDQVAAVDVAAVAGVDRVAGVGAEHELVLLARVGADLSLVGGARAVAQAVGPAARVVPPLDAEVGGPTRFDHLRPRDRTPDGSVVDLQFHEAVGSLVEGVELGGQLADPLVHRVEGEADHLVGVHLGDLEHRRRLDRADRTGVQVGEVEGTLGLDDEGALVRQPLELAPPEELLPVHAQGEQRPAQLPLDPVPAAAPLPVGVQLHHGVSPHAQAPRPRALPATNVDHEGDVSEAARGRDGAVPLSEVGEHPVARLPIPPAIPTGGIDPGVEALEPARGGRLVLGQHRSVGQLPDEDVAVVHRSPLRLEADVAPARRAVRTASHDLPVDRQRDVAVQAGDAVVVPLRTGLGAVLGREGAAATAAVDGGHRRAVDREDVPVGGVALGVAVGVVEHLHLDTAMEGHTLGGDVVRPDEDPRVAPRHQVTPLELEHEVLVHARGAQLPGGLAGAVQDATARDPGGGCRVDPGPTRQAQAVEERDEAGVRLLGGGDGRQEQQEGNGERVHGQNVP